MTSPSANRIVTMAFMAAVCVAGCKENGTVDASDDVKLEFKLQPDPPKVGGATVTIKLMGKDANPVSGATIKLEGNMNHAGMTPVFADAKEVEPGKYEAGLKFTMGGDWFVLIDANLADGRKLNRKIDVPAVKR